MFPLIGRGFEAPRFSHRQILMLPALTRVPLGDHLVDVMPTGESFYFLLMVRCENVVGNAIVGGRLIEESDYDDLT